MNKKQYNNIIANTLKHEHTEDSLSAARAVFKNMGVALPGGDIKEVFETVKTDNYMGWKSCTMEEAQAAANNGTAAMGISDNKIVVLAADDAEEPIEPTAEVLAITDSTPAVAVAGLQYYSYSYGGCCNSGGCCGDSTSPSCKKAIIIVPGVMGTELKLAKTQNGLSAGTKVWPPIEGNENFSNASVLKKTLDKLASIACDTNGNSIYDLCVKNDDNYGAFDQYKSLYNKLKSNYGTTRDVIFWGYDWRKPNSVSGNLLKQKVKQYDCVTIVAHSMGGLVTSHMLKDTSIRGKIEKVITLGTPYLGSLEMLPVMSHGHFGYIDNATESLPKILAWIAKEKVLQPTLQAMAVNIPSLYELLPTEKFFSLGNRWYYSIKYLITGTQECKTFSSTRTWIQIAKDEDAMGSFNLNLFDKATSAHASLWSGNTHITNKVDTYYIIGDTYDTMRTYTFKDGFTDSYSTTSVKSGDGTVLSYSASINDLYSSKTYFVESDHNDLIHKSNILNFVKGIICNDFTLPNGIRTYPFYKI